MKQDTTKFNDFITLYHLLFINLIKTKKPFTVIFYYLNNQFNIEIEETTTQEKIFNYHFDSTIEEYFELIILFGIDFIETHTITLPMFDHLTKKDSELYYRSLDSIKKPLDYNKAMVHVLRNNIFEYKFYYFNGLNDISYEIQEKALRKLNQENEKIYIKNRQN